MNSKHGAERTLPHRAFDLYDNMVTSFWLFLRNDLSLPGENQHPDPRAGRTDMGTTYEDFHLFWPLRPKTYLQFPQKDDTIISLSREEFLLKEEQKTFTSNDNALWMAQQLRSNTPEQLYGNQLFVEREEKIGKVYAKEVDLRTDMGVPPRYSFKTFSNQLKEFWEDHPVDREIANRFSVASSTSIGAGLLSFAVLTPNLWRNPLTRPFAVPYSLLASFGVTIGFDSLLSSMLELRGINAVSWSSRVSDGIREYKQQLGLNEEITEDVDSMSAFFIIQPFKNPFTTK